MWPSKVSVIKGKGVLIWILIASDFNSLIHASHSSDIQSQEDEMFISLAVLLLEKCLDGDHLGLLLQH